MATTAETATAETSYVVEELETLREQYVKNFRLSDGSYTAVVYNEPVHYMKDGDWAEIDNSLVSTDVKITREPDVSRQESPLTPTTTFYENKNNDFKVQLPQTFGDSAPISVNYKGYTLQFAIENVNAVQAVVSQPATQAQLTQKMQGELAATADAAQQAAIRTDYATAAKNFMSSVMYRSIANRTHVQYVVTGQKLKENILLETVPTQSTFTFQFMYDGLTPVLQADNSVVFHTADGEDIFVVEAPFMYDSDEGYSDEVAVSLAETAAGCVYTLTPDAAWLAAPERVYPVTLDPQVTTTQVRNQTQDAGVQQSNPTTNYKNLDRIYVGSASGSKAGRMYYKLLQWPSATGLNANTITSASLRLRYYPQASWQTAHDMTIDVYKLSSSWSSETITWNNQTGIGGTRISSKTITDSRNKTGGYDSFNVLSWVKAHYSSPSTDYGIRLQPRTVVDATNRACYISSDYTTNTALRPIIVIVYAPMWPAVDKPTIRSRADWGARSPITSQYDLRTRDPIRIIFHHTADKFSSTNVTDIINEIKRIQVEHMDGEGWDDIAYNYIIDPAGGIWTGHTIDDAQGCHTYGYNNDIGVVILGDFEPRLANFWIADTLNDAQKTAMTSLSKWLCYKYRLPNSSSNATCPISTHRTFSDTDCPGENAGNWIEQTLQERINSTYIE